jgi:fructose-bisphosphate aldolase class I
MASLIRETCAQLCAPGKGLLAADESVPTVGKRLAACGAENTSENRRALRELLFTTASLSDSLSGVILFEEQLLQATSDGTAFAKLLHARGVLPGIKLDEGVRPLPGGSRGETWTAGMDTLEQRCASGTAAGACFAGGHGESRLGRPGGGRGRGGSHGAERT